MTPTKQRLLVIGLIVIGFTRICCFFWYSFFSCLQRI